MSIRKPMKCSLAVVFRAHLGTPLRGPPSLAQPNLCALGQRRLRGTHMALCLTHVPAPAELGARRCGFSLGRRVASSGPVACSSSSTSSFFSRPKGSNRRTRALRTRADCSNGGGDIARHPTHGHVWRVPPLTCMELNGILRSSCLALRNGDSASRPVDSSEWTRSVNQGFFGDQRVSGDTVPVPPAAAAAAAVAAPPVESSDWTRSANQGFFGDTSSPDDTVTVDAANSAVSVPGFFSDLRVPDVTDVATLAGQLARTDPELYAHIAGGIDNLRQVVSSPLCIFQLAREAVPETTRRGAARKPGASLYTRKRLSRLQPHALYHLIPLSWTLSLFEAKLTRWRGWQFSC